MTEDNALETRLQQPFSQSLLIAMKWVDEGLNPKDIAVVLAVTVRALEENRNMPGLSQLLGSMLQRD